MIEIAALIAVLVLISGCQPAVDTAVEPATSVIPEAAPPASCGDQGYLSTELFDALAGDIGGEHKIAFIIALPEINGDSDVIIRDLYFRGQLDWNSS
jgi:hypothetical protein